ncbi:sugar ABC transporter ATP-binding protein [Amycolatopsis ultiminotia]|uniref:Sugar ABC transporter ATP-binding protein n=1 Tax=Amycolatopsis ultiminotia TaxID=543629 RepID=A0ABP6XKC0_9PSEU
MSTKTVAPALAVTDVSKAFAGTQALLDVSFAVTAGRVHALLGGNGSGKSTLIKILAGVHRADPGGSVVVNGTSVAADRLTPGLAREIGLRFVHQNPGLIRDMTVVENVALTNGFSRTRYGGVAWGALRRRTRRLLDRFEIEADPNQQLSELRPADQTMVAVARALEDDQDGLSTLVLDEPTAALPRHEAAFLLEAMRRCASTGHTILFVSHRIDEVLAVSESVTVLRDGVEVLTREAEGLDEQQLVQAIVGRSPRAVYQVPPATSALEACVEVEHLRGGPIHDVSFTARKGEVVGIAGLLGSGRSELLRMIYGAHPRESGDITIEGGPYQANDPSSALRNGVALVPEDRAADGAFLDMSVLENLSIGQLGKFREPLRFRHDLERAAAREDIEKFTVKTQSPSTPLASLSGGNQQKVLLARCLRSAPRVLLLDEPTQGIDVGARADIFAILSEHVARGLTVIIVSSDFEELARVTDRVLILRGGRIVADVPAQSVDAAAITELVYSAPMGASS